MKRPSLYVALLRGINVGGKNLIKMSELKACFEAAGFHKVSTYIQSGNVLFQSAQSNDAKLVIKIERAISTTFQCQSRIVLFSHEQLRHVVDHAPPQFGTEPAVYRYDVIFLKTPLSAREAIKTVPVKEGVDQAFAGKDVLYFARRIDQAAMSHLSRLVSLPIYQQMTIRNWNTTTKLLSLLDASAAEHK